jgi:DNA repair protein RadA/Sms
MRTAKDQGVATWLVGHINKAGSLAGPKVMEHMVDTVLEFEGDRHYNFRIVRSIKNRFGATPELGIYEMRPEGLREVSNPSEIFLTQNNEAYSGVAVAASMQGMRPILIEVQALLSPAAYGTPQRSATGLDLKRMSMLLAVLEKKCGFRMGDKDVFLNLVGGIKMEDPALDLAIVLAMVSSLQDQPIGGRSVFAAEVGLTGEVRAVGRIEQRVAEAEKLGFEQILLSANNAQGLQTRQGKIRIVPVQNVQAVFREVFDV